MTAQQAFQAEIAKRLLSKMIKRETSSKGRNTKHVEHLAVKQIRNLCVTANGKNSLQIFPTTTLYSRLNVCILSILLLP